MFRLICAVISILSMFYTVKAQKNATASTQTTTTVIEPSSPEFTFRDLPSGLFGIDLSSKTAPTSELKAGLKVDLPPALDSLSVTGTNSADDPTRFFAREIIYPETALINAIRTGTDVLIPNTFLGPDTPLETVTQNNPQTNEVNSNTQHGGSNPAKLTTGKFPSSNGKFLANDHTATNTLTGLNTLSIKRGFLPSENSVSDLNNILSGGAATKSKLDKGKQETKPSVLDNTISDLHQPLLPSNHKLSPVPLVEQPLILPIVHDTTPTPDALPLSLEPLAPEKPTVKPVTVKQIPSTVPLADNRMAETQNKPIPNSVSGLSASITPGILPHDKSNNLVLNSIQDIQAEINAEINSNHLPSGPSSILTEMPSNQILVNDINTLIETPAKVLNSDDFVPFPVPDILLDKNAFNSIEQKATGTSQKNLKNAPVLDFDNSPSPWESWLLNKNGDKTVDPTVAQAIQNTIENIKHLGLTTAADNAISLKTNSDIKTSIENKQKESKEANIKTPPVLSASIDIGPKVEKTEKAKPVQIVKENNLAPTETSNVELLKNPAVAAETTRFDNEIPLVGNSNLKQVQIKQMNNLAPTKTSNVLLPINPAVATETTHFDNGLPLVGNSNLKQVQTKQRNNLTPIETSNRQLPNNPALVTETTRFDNGIPLGGSSNLKTIIANRQTESKETNTLTPPVLSESIDVGPKVEKTETSKPEPIQIVQVNNLASTENSNVELPTNPVVAADTIHQVNNVGMPKTNSESTGPTTINNLQNIHLNSGTASQTNDDFAVHRRIMLPASRLGEAIKLLQGMRSVDAGNALLQNQFIIDEIKPVGDKDAAGQSFFVFRPYFLNGGNINDIISSVGNIISTLNGQSISNTGSTVNADKLSPGTVLQNAKTGVGLPVDFNTGISAKTLGTEISKAPLNTGIGAVTLDTGINAVPLDTGIGAAPLNTGISKAPFDTGISSSPILSPNLVNSAVNSVNLNSDIQTPLNTLQQIPNTIMASSPGGSTGFIVPPAAALSPNNAELISNSINSNADVQISNEILSNLMSGPSSSSLLSETPINSDVLTPVPSSILGQSKPLTQTGVIGNNNVLTPNTPINSDVLTPVPSSIFGLSKPLIQTGGNNNVLTPNTPINSDVLTSDPNSILGLSIPLTQTGVIGNNNVLTPNTPINSDVLTPDPNSILGLSTPLTQTGVIGNNNVLKPNTPINNDVLTPDPNSILGLSTPLIQTGVIGNNKVLTPNTVFGQAQILDSGLLVSPNIGISNSGRSDINQPELPSTPKVIRLSSNQLNNIKKGSTVSILDSPNSVHENGINSETVDMNGRVISSSNFIHVGDKKRTQEANTGFNLPFINHIPGSTNVDTTQSNSPDDKNNVPFSSNFERTAPESNSFISQNFEPSLLSTGILNRFDSSKNGDINPETNSFISSEKGDRSLSDNSIGQKNNAFQSNSFESTVTKGRLSLNSNFREPPFKNDQSFSSLNGKSSTSDNNNQQKEWNVDSATITETHSGKNIPSATETPPMSPGLESLLANIPENQIAVINLDDNFNVASVDSVNSINELNFNQNSVFDQNNIQSETTAKTTNSLRDHGLSPHSTSSSRNFHLEALPRDDQGLRNFNERIFSTADVSAREKIISSSSDRFVPVNDFRPQGSREFRTSNTDPQIFNRVRSSSSDLNINPRDNNFDTLSDLNNIDQTESNSAMARERTSLNQFQNRREENRKRIGENMERTTGRTVENRDFRTRNDRNRFTNNLNAPDRIWESRRRNNRIRNHSGRNIGIRENESLNIGIPFTDVNNRIRRNRNVEELRRDNTNRDTSIRDIHGDTKNRRNRNRDSRMNENRDRGNRVGHDRNRVIDNRIGDITNRENRTRSGRIRNGRLSNERGTISATRNERHRTTSTIDRIRDGTNDNNNLSNRNRITSNTSRNRQTSNTSRNRPTSNSSRNRQTSSTSRNRQTTNSSRNRQTSSTSSRNRHISSTSRNRQISRTSRIRNIRPRRLFQTREHRGNFVETMRRILLHNARELGFRHFK